MSIWSRIKGARESNGRRQFEWLDKPTRLNAELGLHHRGVDNQTQAQRIKRHVAQSGTRLPTVIEARTSVKIKIEVVTIKGMGTRARCKNDYGKDRAYLTA